MSCGENPSAAPEADKCIEAVVANRHHHLRQHYRLALAILGVFVLVEAGLGRLTFGHYLHLQAHHWMHSWLVGSEPPERLPLVLVDITDLKQKGEQTALLGEMDYTPRTNLARLVQALAAARPAVIGLDIDLSPETNGLVWPGSFPLFQMCLDLTSNNIPVFLGVHRMASAPSNSWLGADKFASLAAGTSRPKGTVVQLPERYEFGNGRPPLESLSKQLAAAYQARPVKSRSDLPFWLAWATERIAVRTPVPRVQEFKISEYFVDFSHRRALEQNLLRYDQVLASETNRLQAEDLAGRLQGKIVLVGDARIGRTLDTAIVPGEPEPVPGIYAHACGTLTLVQAPLHVLQTWVGLGLCGLFSFLSIKLIHKLCHKFSGTADVTQVPLSLLLTAAAMGLVFLVGYGLMKGYHVMWLEMLAAWLVLAIHGAIEVFVSSVNWHHFKRGLRGIPEALTTVRHTK